jgi:GAF domain-containing protein
LPRSALGLLDTQAEGRFDRITRLAQQLFDVPIALVSLVDEDRQWFESRQGPDVRETRGRCPLVRAIKGDRTLLVPDASIDERFAANPLVVGELTIRFYAGCPIAGRMAHYSAQRAQSTSAPGLCLGQIFRCCDISPRW